MDPAKVKAIAAKGGKAAHEMGKAHKFDRAEAAEAGRKGGYAAHAARVAAKAAEKEAETNTTEPRGTDENEEQQTGA